MIETLRLGKFVLCLFGLGWSLGMLKAYWGLLRNASARLRATWVPGCMIFVTTGLSLILLAILWAQITDFHSRLTVPSILAYFGVIALDAGLVFMHRGVSLREIDRQADKYKPNGRHAIPPTRYTDDHEEGH